MRDCHRVTGNVACSYLRSVSAARESKMPSLPAHPGCKDNFRPSPTTQQGGAQGNLSASRAAVSFWCDTLPSMAISTCVKCDGHFFELKQAEPKGSSFKVYFVQCSN